MNLKSKHFTPNDIIHSQQICKTWPMVYLIDAIILIYYYK